MTARADINPKQASVSPCLAVREFMRSHVQSRASPRDHRALEELRQRLGKRRTGNAALGDDRRHVLRLGDFDDGEAAFLAELARAQNAGVGAFDRLDGEHRAVLHANALADIEAAHLLGDVPAELDVLLLGGRRRPAGDLARLSPAAPARNRSPDETRLPSAANASVSAPSSVSSLLSRWCVMK